uniref:Uncharacterized protein n=1 Tax=Fagus sylvatica TaxID=28930 RepID=A0A2N9IGU5_FAGSY
MFLEILGIAGPEHGMVWPWQTSALPCNPLACLRISLALHCLGIVLAGMAVAANATPFAVFSMEALGMAIATYAIALAAHGMPWLGSPWHAMALPWQPAARGMPWHCHGSPWLALPWHGLGSPWHAMALPWQPVACLALALPRQPVACLGRQPAARGMPWHGLGSPWHALAWPRQPVACHGIARQPVAACLACLPLPWHCLAWPWHWHAMAWHVPWQPPWHLQACQAWHGMPVAVFVHAALPTLISTIFDDFQHFAAAGRHRAAATAANHRR